MRTRQKERFRPDDPGPRPPGPKRDEQPIDYSKFEEVEEEALEHGEDEGE